MTFFFYMGVVFNIVCWVNVFQSFLSPLKSFRCCKNFASSLMFRYWKSFLILSVQQVFSFHSSFWFYEGIQQVLSSLVFLRQALKNDQAMIIFSSVIYCSISLHLSFHTILCFFCYCRPSHTRDLVKQSFSWQYRMLLTCQSSLQWHCNSQM